MALPIVTRFLISLDDNKFIGFITFVFVWGVFGVFALQPTPPTPPPTYKAVGALSLKAPPPLFTATGGEVQQAGRSVNRNILLSPRVLEKSAKGLQVTEREIVRIAEKLTINFPEQEAPQIISLEYNENQKPDFAQLILLVFMDNMVEESRLLNTAQLTNKVNALTTRLGQVQNDLKKAEQSLYNYISKDGSSLLAVQDGSLFSGITTSQEQQRQIQLALDEIEGQINNLVKQLSLTPEQAYTSSALSADSIIAGLRSQILQVETQLDTLGKDLRPAHPTMVQLQQQKQSLEQLLQERAKEVIGTDGLLTELPAEKIRLQSNLDPARQQLANTLVALQTQQEGLIRQLESIRLQEETLRQQYEKFPEKQLEQARLIQQVESQRALYRTILAALVDAQAAEAETTSSLAIAQSARVQTIQPKQPGKINPLLLIGGGFFVGIIAAGGVIFLLATLDTRLHTSEEIKTLLSDQEVFLLAELPFVSSLTDQGEEVPVLIDIDSPYFPFYERLRSNVRRLASEPPKVILISSISQGEGKSITAYNLAIASATAGKRTLLLEADLRSGSLSEYFNLTISEESKIEPLRYYADRSNCIRLVPEIENLYIVPSPGPQKKAAAIMESGELKLLLEDAKRRFDVVIIDTPALSNANDALLLESLSDGIVIVTRPGFTRSNLLNETIEQFNEAEVQLLGAVINQSELSVPLKNLPLMEEFELDETPLTIN
jgi:capsular exopolysaccharide synthesis family protein